jgi:hypothetical protein
MRSIKLRFNLSEDNSVEIAVEKKQNVEIALNYILMRLFESSQWVIERLPNTDVDCCSFIVEKTDGYSKASEITILEVISHIINDDEFHKLYESIVNSMSNNEAVLEVTEKVSNASEISKSLISKPSVDEVFQKINVTISTDGKKIIVGYTDSDMKPEVFLRASGEIFKDPTNWQFHGIDSQTFSIENLKQSLAKEQITVQLLFGLEKYFRIIDRSLRNTSSEKDDMLVVSFYSKNH